KWLAWEKKWEANEKKWQEQHQKWEANEKRWREWEEKWGKNQQVIENILLEIKKLHHKHDSTIGALGARWGLQSESAFRNGLQSILEESFPVKVERYQDYDYEGKVFGRPDQVELDVIIFNETLILCEIKSSMSRSDLYAFWRKKNFYEEKHGKAADRSLVISPMIDPRAEKVAAELGIELFGYAGDVKF
ncbi:MAG: PD-(D/E)XK nuclease family protein, partial [Desulfonatronovibrionaceae bacterium]